MSNSLPVVDRAKLIEARIKPRLMKQMRNDWAEDQENLVLPSHRRVIKRHCPNLFAHIVLASENLYPESASLAGYASDSIMKFVLGDLLPKLCPACSTKFFWGQYCSASCSGSHAAYTDSARLKRKRTNMKRYGTDNPASNPEIHKKSIANRDLTAWKSKMESTSLKRHGVKNAGGTSDSRKKAEATWIENYGSVGAKYEQQFEKSKATCLKRYGVEFSTQTPQMKAASVATNLRKHGVEHHLQHPELLAARIKAGYKKRRIKFADGIVRSVQSKDERLVIRVLLRNGYSVYSPPMMIRYSLNGAKRFYHPDLIATKDDVHLVIEVKSDYTMFADWEKNLAKFRYANRYCEKRGMTFALFAIRKMAGVHTVKRCMNPTETKIHALFDR